MSANVVPLSIGTETDTSIIGPAKTNGVVGIKPTVGTTSIKGVIPISHNLDTVGTIARTVADAAYGLSAIFEYENDFSKHVAASQCLKGAKFGLPQKRFFDLLPDDIREIASRVLEDIRAAGSEIVPTEFPCADSRIPPDGSWDWLACPISLRRYVLTSAKDVRRARGIGVHDRQD